MAIISILTLSLGFFGAMEIIPPNCELSWLDTQKLKLLIQAEKGDFELSQIKLRMDSCNDSETSIHAEIIRNNKVVKQTIQLGDIPKAYRLRALAVAVTESLNPQPPPEPQKTRDSSWAISAGPEISQFFSNSLTAVGAQLGMTYLWPRFLVRLRLSGSYTNKSFSPGDVDIFTYSSSIDIGYRFVFSRFSLQLGPSIEGTWIQIRGQDNDSGLTSTQDRLMFFGGAYLEPGYHFNKYLSLHLQSRLSLGIRNLAIRIGEETSIQPGNGIFKTALSLRWRFGGR